MLSKSVNSWWFGWYHTNQYMFENRVEKFLYLAAENGARKSKIGIFVILNYFPLWKILRKQVVGEWEFFVILYSIFIHTLVPIHQISRLVCAIWIRTLLATTYYHSNLPATTYFLILILCPFNCQIQKFNASI